MRGWLVSPRRALVIFGAGVGLWVVFYLLMVSYDRIRSLREQVELAKDELRLCEGKVALLGGEIDDLRGEVGDLLGFRVVDMGEYKLAVFDGVDIPSMMLKLPVGWERKDRKTLSKGGNEMIFYFYGLPIPKGTDAPIEWKTEKMWVSDYRVTRMRGNPGLEYYLFENQEGVMVLEIRVYYESDIARREAEEIIRGMGVYEAGS